MTGSLHLGPSLDERLDGLPYVPPEYYLAAGQQARRRRHRRRAGGAAACLLAAGVLVTALPLPHGGDDQTASERWGADTGQSTPAESSLSELRVEQGAGGIDSFTTEDIPAWAEEYGNHGPAAISPDGRLWVAPEAEVVRSVADPMGPAGRATGITHSYAVELRWEDPDEVSKDGLVWSFIYQEDGDTGTLGQLDSPNRWTADFALWAEDLASDSLGRPSFAERLVQFEGDRSETLVPGADVELVKQVSEVDTGDREQYPRRSAAEVRVGGYTYFVLATGGQEGHAFYEAYDARVVAAADLDGFLAFVAGGFVPQIADS